MVPFNRFRHEIRLQYDKNTKTSPDLLQMIRNIVAIQKNFSAVHEVVKEMAASQSLLEVQFTTPFVWPDPDRDDHVPSTQRRYVKYNLKSSDYDPLRKNLVARLSDIEVVRYHSANSKTSDRLPPNLSHFWYVVVLLSQVCSESTLMDYPSIRSRPSGSNSTN